MIKSVIEIGDELECDIFGLRETVVVKDIKVIFNHPIQRPIDLVIYLELKDKNSEMEWGFTSNNLQIIRHLDPIKEANGNKLN